jgi:hypothetical protein
MEINMSSDMAVPAALSAAQPLWSQAQSPATDEWFAYPFNYNGAAHPPLREVNDISDTLLSLGSVEHFLTYHFRPSSPDHDRAAAETIDDPLMVVAISTSNAGHAMSEIMSFVNFARDLPSGVKFGVSQAFVDKLPLIAQFFQRLYDADRVVVLRADQTYRLQHAWIRRENHFNASCNWMDLDYTINDNVLSFENLHERIKFDDDPAPVHSLVRRYPLHDRVMLLKTADSRNLTTPGRALILDESYRTAIQNSGFHLVSVEQFESVEEYICTLYHARQIVFSYGSTTCTNRFFVNPTCDVIVLANQAYQFEYDYPVSTGAHWHVRHSHLLPVRRQRVVIGHNNVFSEADVINLLGLVVD